VHRLGLARGGIAPARLHAPRLEIPEVAARGDLAVFLLARQPHFQVIGLRAGESDVAAAQRHHAVRQLQPLQHGFGVTGELFVRGLRLFRRTICTISTLSNWCWRIMPRVSLPADPASERKHGVCATIFSGSVSASRIWSRTRLVTGTSAVGIR
jgi:hypothetical protein